MSKTNECRTCFNAVRGWHPLTTRTRDCKKRLKSYGEILEEVTKINTKDNKYKELPQFICGNCSRRLKSAHAFIQQAVDVNTKLYSMLNEKLNCLRETQIDLEPDLEIKIKSTGRKSEQENLECLQEISIDIETCLEIKVENDEPESKKTNLDCLHETQIDIEDGMNIKVKNNSQQQNKLNLIKDCVTRDTVALEKKSLSELSTSIAINNEIDDNDFESLQSNSFDWEDSNESSHRELIKNKTKSPSTDKTSAENGGNFDIAVPCDKCNKIFKNSKLLAVHRRISHIPEEKKCTCHLCGNKFTRYCNMYKHMRTFHGPETVTLISKRPEADYIYKCDKCPKKYSRKKSLIFHTKLKHSSVESVEIKENKTSKNDKRKSADKGSLCPICGSSFTSKTQLTVHLRRHTGEKPFKCGLCDRAFLLVTQLNSHKRLHTGEKPYKCQLCGKAFRVSDDLRQHMRTHTNVRPHKCSQCERSFKHTQDLKIHLRSHTGERPYICGVCGDNFQRYNTLRAHRIRLGHLGNVLNNIRN